MAQTMKESPGLLKSLPQWIHKATHGVHLAGETAQSRQQGLSIFLWGSLACVLLIDIAALFDLLPLTPGTQHLVANLSPILILVLLGLLVANRTGQTRPAGLIFLALVSVVLPVVMPFELLNQTLILFALPVMAASFILVPPSSILIAVLSAIGYATAWLENGAHQYFNYPSAIVLVILSLVIWQIAARMEKAIRQLRKSEHKLQSEIRERREAEEELKQRNRDISTLLDSLPGFAFFKSLDFRYITANQTFCDAIGCAKEKIHGKTDFDLLPEEIAHRYREADEDIFRTGKPILDIEMEMREPKGNGRILVATRKVPLHDEEGNIIGLIGLGYDITARKRAEQELRVAHDELVDAYSATLEGWARALEMREEETAGHCERVVDLTLELARRLGVDVNEFIHLQRGAFLHDIGKMGIPDQILLKHGPLNEEEWRVMRRHPQMAYDLLSPIDYLAPAVNIPYCHHERWDGSGYPRGLKGEEIPYHARIFAVVDVWDALVSHRPYREAWPEEKALEYLAEQSGRQFDPRVVSAFCEMRATNLSRLAIAPQSIELTR